MSDKQITERIAKFMSDENWLEGDVEHMLKSNDWSQWRWIEEKLMEDGKSKLIKDYMKWFDGKFHYMGADLEERCSALISVLPNS